MPFGRILQEYSLSGKRSLDGCGAILLNLEERGKAIFLIENEKVDMEVKYESLRLMMYGYKFELEAVKSKSLFSFMPHLSHLGP